MKKSLLAICLLTITSLSFASTGTEKLMNDMASGNYTVKFEGQGCSLLLSYSTAGHVSSGLPISLEAVMKKEGDYSISSFTEFDNAIASASKIKIVERQGLILSSSKIVVNVDPEGKPTSAVASERILTDSREIKCVFNM